jgi:hypothetical protein
MFNEGRKEVPGEGEGAQGCWYGLDEGGGMSAVSTQGGKVWGVARLILSVKRIHFMHSVKFKLLS